MFFLFLISGIGKNSHFFRWTNCFRVLSLSLLLIARIYGEHVKLNKHLHTMTQCMTDSCFVPLKIISSPSHPRLRPRAHYVRRLSHIYWQMPKAEWQIWSLGIEEGISYRAHSGNNKEEEKSSKALLNVNAEHVGSSMGFFIQMNFQFFQIDFFREKFLKRIWVVSSFRRWLGRLTRDAFFDSVTSNAAPFSRSLGFVVEVWFKLSVRQRLGGKFS